MLLLELKYRDFLKGQETITDLFPDFPSRVRTIGDKGGSKLEKVGKSIWKFEVSSSKEGTYTVTIQFVNIPETIKRLVKDEKVWNKQGTKVNYSKLALAVLANTDLKVRCTCPAFQYWGPAYQLTKKDAIYGKGEKRPPKVRNPKQKGLFCKHLDVTLRTFLFYHGEMAKVLKKYYKRVVEQAQEEVLDGRDSIYEQTTSADIEALPGGFKKKRIKRKRRTGVPVMKKTGDNVKEQVGQEVDKYTIYKMLVDNLVGYAESFPATGVDNLLDQVLDAGTACIPNDDLAKEILMNVLISNFTPPAAVQALLNTRFSDLPPMYRPYYRKKDDNKKKVAFWSSNDIISDRVKSLLLLQGDKKGYWCDEEGNKVKLIA